MRGVGKAMQAQGQWSGSQLEARELDSSCINDSHSGLDGRRGCWRNSGHALTVVVATNVTFRTPSAVDGNRRSVTLMGEKTAFLVTFHGVRGSTPCHGDDIVRYGGNTSCVSVLSPDNQPILFDLGTGLRYFGRECLNSGTKFVGTCLLSHSHFDHTQGLPFFSPLLHEETVLKIHGPAQDDGMSVKEMFQ